MRLIAGMAEAYYASIAPHNPLGPISLAAGLQIAASIPNRLQAPAALHPPPAVKRTEAVAALEASGTKMARAFDVLTCERGGRMGIANAVVGTISVYQLAEWATAHIARHNRQAKQILGEA